MDKSGIDALQEFHLRARQAKLRVEIASAKYELHRMECELISLSRQLGEFEDLRQPNSGRDTGAMP